MKIYILTSVALFAEYGDLDSLDNPSVNVSVHPSLQKAQVQMKNELQTEKEDAKAGGCDNFLTKIEEKSASYQQGEIGSGCSYNLVTWEITEKEVEIPMRHYTLINWENAKKHYTVFTRNGDQMLKVFVVESQKENAYWWACEGDHEVHFVKDEIFNPRLDLIDIPDEDVFTYYGNGTTERPDNVADMETLLWLLRDKQ